MSASRNNFALKKYASLYSNKQHDYLVVDSDHEDAADTPNQCRAMSHRKEWSGSDGTCSPFVIGFNIAQE